MGALLLASVLAGAVLTHLLLIGGSAAMPATLFVVTSLIALARREESFRLAERVGRWRTRAVQNTRGGAEPEGR